MRRNPPIDGGPQVCLDTWRKIRSADPCHKYEENDPEIVDRNDAKESPDVEGLEIGGGTPRIQQNSSDEEPRQDEEQIYTRPTETTKTLETMQESWK